MKHVLKSLSFFGFPVTVLFAHLIASRLVLNLYSLFPNLDIPFHFAGGLAIAYTSSKILIYLEKEQVMAALPPALFLVFIFSLTAAATVFWEFAEFSVDQLFKINIQISLANTMQDQFMGILGGVMWLLIYTRKFGNITEIRKPS